MFCWRRILRDGDRQVELDMLMYHFHSCDFEFIRTIVNTRLHHVVDGNSVTDIFIKIAITITKFFVLIIVVMKTTIGYQQ